jgi:prepilin-type processing-associated H-X9-DG protein
MPVNHQTTLEIQLPECNGDIVQVKNLNFAYADGHVALRGVNLKLCEGEKVA